MSRWIPTHVFDGFCHRDYDEDLDGWMESQPDSEKYPAVSIASDILAMYEEIKHLRKVIWEKDKQITHYKNLLDISRGII